MTTDRRARLGRVQKAVTENPVTHLWSLWCHGCDAEQDVHGDPTAEFFKWMEVHQDHGLGGFVTPKENESCRCWLDGNKARTLADYLAESERANSPAVVAKREVFRAQGEG